MVASVVGTPKTPTGGATSTLNPTIAMGKPALNDWLFALVIQASSQTPGVPTDNQGNLWQILDGINPAPGITGIICYAPNVKGANTTITLPTVANSTYVVAELTGVPIPATITGPKGVSSDPATVPSIATANCTGVSGCGLGIPVPSVKGALVVALIAHVAPNTFTFQETGWSQVATGNTLGLAFDAETITAATSGSVQAAWTIAQASAGLCLGVSFPSA